MKARNFWVTKIEELLAKRNVVWLSGVRRVGKTTLCKQLVEDNRYFDCELPRIRDALTDPAHFLKRLGPGRIVLDEVHRLINPSEILKIASDHFQHTKVIATGSSTLAAKKKFRDTLTGRKFELWLTPAIYSDLHALGCEDLDERMIRGGLPPFLLGSGIDDRNYVEWLDSYWSKDLQELFVIEKRSSFIKFLEMLFRQSGELFEAQSFSAPCEVSRQTIQNYLEVLETTLLITVLRPYSGGGVTELKSQPKVFGFDTGFISYFRNWASAHDEARGHLLEHLVLNELNARFLRSQVFYWRNKQKHEVDFVVKAGRREEITAIECKVNTRRFSAGNLTVFRRLYPQGRNILVCLEPDEKIERTFNGLEVRCVPYHALGEELESLL